MAVHVPSPGSQPRADHSLPPSVKRHGGTFPLAAEGGATGQVQGADWLEHLPWVLLGLHTAPKEEAEVLAAEAIWSLSGAAQPAAAASTCTAGCSSKVGHSQHSETNKEGGEGARGGGAGGRTRVRVRMGGHRTTGRHVPQPILCAGEGEEEVSAGDGSNRDVGLCGTLEATRGIQDSSGSTATPTWPSGQVLGVRF